MIILLVFNVYLVESPYFAVTTTVTVATLVRHEPADTKTGMPSKYHSSHPGWDVQAKSSDTPNCIAHSFKNPPPYSHQHYSVSFSPSVCFLEQRRGGFHPAKTVNPIQPSHVFARNAPTAFHVSNG